MGTGGIFSIAQQNILPYLNGSWEFVEDLAGSGADHVELVSGQTYLLCNLQTEIAYVGFGATAAVADDQSDTDKGRPLGAGKEMLVCVGGAGKFLSVTPDSGTSGVRVLKVLAP